MMRAVFETLTQTERVLKSLKDVKPAAENCSKNTEARKKYQLTSDPTSSGRSQLFNDG